MLLDIYNPFVALALNMTFHPFRLYSFLWSAIIYS